MQLTLLDMVTKGCSATCLQYMLHMLAIPLEPLG